MFPAVIDVHLHFNEPGRTEWEGAATGSRALAAGGGAVFFDMPLNSTPCTVNAREFDRKRAALEAASITDFGLWGGLVPGNIGEMAELAERGVVGFKAFMCDSGLPEFPRADDFTLFEGLARGRAPGPAGGGARGESRTDARARRERWRSKGGRGARDFLESRPVVAEVEAIERATLIGGRSRREAAHRPHQFGAGRSGSARKRERAAWISRSKPAPTICSSPKRIWSGSAPLPSARRRCATPKQHDALWKTLLDGTIDDSGVGSFPRAAVDERPARFMQAWGGIAGVQSTLAVLLEQGHFRRESATGTNRRS